jgi:hypothetical protein
VPFDRMCKDGGLRHLLTEPRSPTTTGKVERFHRRCGRSSLRARRPPPSRTPRPSSARGCTITTSSDHIRASAWPCPGTASRLARVDPVELDEEFVVDTEPAAAPRVTQRVGRNGLISFATVHYRTGVGLAGEDVSVMCNGGLVHLHHRGVLVAAHARRHCIDKQAAGLRRGVPPVQTKRPSATAASVTRKVEGGGNVCFTDTNYRVGAKFRRRQVQVAVVGEPAEIPIGSELLRTHPIRHDRTSEHGALANPRGRPSRINAAQPSRSVAHVPELICRPVPDLDPTPLGLYEEVARLADDESFESDPRSEAS